MGGAAPACSRTVTHTPEQREAVPTAMAGPLAQPAGNLPVHLLFLIRATSACCVFTDTLSWKEWISRSSLQWFLLLCLLRRPSGALPPMTQCPRVNPTHWAFRDRGNALGKGWCALVSFPLESRKMLVVLL